MARNYCGSCGAPLKPDSTACPRCGRSFAVEDDYPDTLFPLSAHATPEQASFAAEQPPRPEQPLQQKNACGQGGCTAPGQNCGAQEASARKAPGSGYAQPPRVYSSRPAAAKPCYSSLRESTETPELLTTADYFAMFAAGAIPVAGFILLCVWAFGERCGVNRRSFARALLLVKGIVALMLIGFVGWVMFFVPWMYY